MDILELEFHHGIIAQATQVPISRITGHLPYRDSTCPITALSLTRPAVARVFSCAHGRIEHTSSSAQELRLFLELLFIGVTLSCSALHVHQLGVAHQSSLRSSTTMMSFSISPLQGDG